MEMDDRNNLNEQSTMSEEYLSQLAQHYGMGHAEEVDRIVPWKKYLDYFMRGILLSLITFTNISWMNLLTQTYGLAILIYGLGNMQQDNRYIAASYRSSIVFAVYHLSCKLVTFGGDWIYVILISELFFYSMILSLFIKGVRQVVHNSEREADIVKSLDGILWSEIYVVCLFLFSTCAGRGGYAFEENIVGGFWLVWIVAAIIMWAVNFSRLGKKLTLDGYGIIVVPMEKQKRIWWGVLSYAVLNILLSLLYTQ